MALSLHRVRESIAAIIATYQCVDGKHNPEHALSEHWEHDHVWPTLKPILFWPGDNMECFDNDALE